MSPVIRRTQDFCDSLGLRVPILMAPMAGACPPALAAAVARAGGLGAGGMVDLDAAGIADWAARVRTASNGAFQLNIWIPDPAPTRDPAREAALRGFLATWGPEVPAEAAEAPNQDFEAQVAAMIAVGPPIMSSIMGLFPSEVVARMKARSIRWFATVTTVAEALAAEAAGADVLVAQGAESGGHRGAFDAAQAEAGAIGLFALIPAVADAVHLPVVATGGIADARGIAAALTLGASAVQIGTGLLRTPEAALPAAWSAGLAAANPEDTVLTRAFSGRAGRALRNAYVRAAAADDAPPPMPFPIQRGLTAAMRAEAAAAQDPDRMLAWAGQSARLAAAEPAEALVTRLWHEARALLAPR